MERPSKMHDHTEKNVNAIGKPDPDKWKRRALYSVHNDKPHTERKPEAAQESTSGSIDSIAYRDGRLELAQRRQQAYQNDRYVTPEPNDSPRYRPRRQGSDVTHKLNASTASKFGGPKGWSRDVSPPPAPPTPPQSPPRRPPVSPPSP